MNKFLSVKELANILGISKVAVIKKIKSGKIPAQKVGNSYIIDRDDITIVSDRTVSEGQKQLIENAVDKTISEYDETLRLLKET